MLEPFGFSSGGSCRRPDSSAISFSFLSVATAAAPMAAVAPAKAFPNHATIPFTLLNLPPALSLCLPASSISSPKSSASFSASLSPSAVLSSVSLLSFNSFSRSFSVACALLSFICHCCVLRSFSPKEVYALSRTCFSSSILLFCSSISLLRT